MHHPGPDQHDDTLLPSVPGHGARPDVFGDELVPEVEEMPAGRRKADRRAPLPLVEARAELGAIPLEHTSLHDVTRQVAALAQATVPGADEVSITLLDGDRPSTVAFTGDLAFRLDERQYEDGFGPCTDAARTGATIPLFDLGREQRYPGFVSAARRAGVTATLSVAMPVPGRVVGALNIYGRGEAGARLDDASVPVAEAFAGAAAVALANAGLLESARRLTEQLREAMTTRAVIEQAKGILVARTGVTPDEAFAALVARSRAEGRKLVLIAGEVVGGAQQAPPA